MKKLIFVSIMIFFNNVWPAIEDPKMQARQNLYRMENAIAAGNSIRYGHFFIRFNYDGEATQTLFDAIYDRDLKRMENAIAARADVEGESILTWNQTPLHFAASRRFTDGVKLLLQAGAKIPDKLMEDAIQWLDVIIKQINEEELQALAVLQNELPRKSYLINTNIQLMNRLQLASEIYAERKAAEVLQKSGKGMKEREKLRKEKPKIIAVRKEQNENRKANAWYVDLVPKDMPEHNKI